jgi:hypothetical protein
VRCGHCGIADTEPVPGFVAESARHGRVVHELAEVCPDCGWWCAPPRDPTDPNLMARTAGHGYSTQVP